MDKKAKVHKSWNIVLRILIILTAYGFIYYQVFHKKDLHHLSLLFSDALTKSGFLGLFVVVLLMMPLNWSIEAAKWRFLVRKIEPVSFLSSFRAIFTGITVSSFTPNRVGEYLGRVFIFTKANRWDGVLATIVGSMSQLLITLLAGSVGLLLFVFRFLHPENYLFGYAGGGLLFMTLATDVFIVFLYYNFPLLAQIRLKIKARWFRKLKQHFHIFSMYNTKELTRILLYSLFRYGVFSLQFYLLLRLFGIEINLPDALMLISVIYFIMAAIPTIALSELGIRGSVALFFFGIYFGNPSSLSDEINLGVFAASTLLWLINIALPAILGTLFVYKLKFIRK